VNSQHQEFPGTIFQAHPIAMKWVGYNPESGQLHPNVCRSLMHLTSYDELQCKLLFEYIFTNIRFNKKKNMKENHIPVYIMHITEVLRKC